MTTTPIEINTVAEPVLETPKDKNALRRKTPTPPSKQLAARIKEFNPGAVETKFREGHHKPGSQNRNK